MAVTVQPWKSTSPNRKDSLSIERAIKTLDRQAQLQNDQLITDLTTVNTDITNITNGTTTVAAKWSVYAGPLWLLWVMMHNA